MELFSRIDMFAHGRVGALLDALPEAGRAQLARAARITELSKGACALAEGAQSRDLGYVLEGALAMEKRLADGRKHIIGMLVPTDMFGRLHDGGSAYDIVALTDCRILAIDRARFQEILDGFPELERIFLVSVLDEVNSAREWLLLMRASKVVARVASFLLLILQRNLRSAPSRGNGRRHLTVRIPIQRRDLADYLGTAADSIARALNELEEDGVIARTSPNEIEINDVAALVAASGSDHFAIDGSERPGSAVAD